jgi:hypothetical protein
MDYPASRVYDEAGERCDFAGVLAGAIPSGERSDERAEF